MPSTNETISLVDAADTAVRTTCVLELLKDSLPLPPFADQAVDGAIAMLDDALKGSALLTEQGDVEGFSGNLDALCWATDSYVCIAGPMDRGSPPDPLKVEKLLKQIQEEMRKVRAGIKDRSGTNAQAILFETSKGFFDVLADILARRATASLTRPSCDYVAAGR